MREFGIEEGRAASKCPHLKIGYFLSISQQVVSVISLKFQLLKYLNREYLKKNIFTVFEKVLKNVSERRLPIEQPLNLKNMQVDSLREDTAEIETGMAEKSSPGTRQTDGKNLIWFGERERKFAKLSMIIFTYRSSS